MDRTERFYKIYHMLTAGRPVPRSRFLDALEISPATFKRDLAYMRDRLHAPIVYDREAAGYRLDRDAGEWHLPGFWLTEAEILALLTVEHLLENLQPGLLGPHIEPLRDRVRQVLDSGKHSAEEIVRRIRILPMGSRRLEPGRFQVIADGLLRRRRLRITHFRRRDGATVERIVSPQRLVHYRDNWYLDAWCHLRKALRVFAVDAVTSVEVLEAAARELADDVMDRDLATGYGIFAGPTTETAVLRFGPVRARWVSRETWHPRQQGGFDDDGAWVLSLPYSDPRELLMDILKYGADVEVVAPPSLRRRVRLELDRARAAYPEDDRQ